MTHSNLLLAIDIVNASFFGYRVYNGEDRLDHIAPPVVVRQAIKYISLSEESRKIWDDPNMLPAHKYQNIPQIDISAYEGDYQVDGQFISPITYTPDGFAVSFVYSANKMLHLIAVIKGSPLYQRFLDMSGIGKICRYLDDHPNHNITRELYLLAFDESDVTDMVANGDPSYDVTMKDIYDQFMRYPELLYVPYRLGWSRVLNIAPISLSPKTESFVLMHNNCPTHVHLSDFSAITTWDGTSMRIENHGVEAEAMKIHTLDEYRSDVFKMRRLEETHEYMRDVSVQRWERPASSQVFVIYTIKGINVDGFEFNMP